MHFLHAQSLSGIYFLIENSHQRQALESLKGTVYKPRRQVRGRGVAQMSTLLNKSYLVKVSTKEEGGSKMPPNSVYVVCTQPLMDVECMDLSPKCSK